MLALEAHVAEDTRVSDSDANRVERGIKAGKTREQVFPRLGKVGAEVTCEGLTVKMKFVKSGDALTVRVVGDGDSVDAAAVREGDLLKKYCWTSSKLAEKLKLTAQKAAALREHLGIDGDPDCTYSVPHHASMLTYYSDALARMRDAMAQQDMDAIWESHSNVKRKKPRPLCSQPGCSRRRPPARARS